MLHITPRAKSELFGLLVHALDRRTTADVCNVGFRLVPGGDETISLGLVLDQPTDGDAVVEHDGRSVLIVDETTAVLLDGLTLDVVETEQGARLSLCGDG
jgi:Fe-S cluster assembly iron-binding protein IscA